MDFPDVNVVLEPIILGGLVIEEDEANPEASNRFLENFRRNQIQGVQGPHEGALVLIRTNGLHHRRNFILPAIIPNQRPTRNHYIPAHRRSAIPLPEEASPRASTSSSSQLAHSSSSRGGVGIASANTDEMGPFQKLWSCECPIPGTQPLIPCADCKRRECFEWTWDNANGDTTAVFQNKDRDITFNPGFSVGTVAVRGMHPLKQGYHHYWEVEMSSDVYGTDMMIGVGTDKTDLLKYSHSFVSLIGLDDQSWGLSYLGTKHHNGKAQHYTKNFGQHTVVGVHLDLWSGTLEYYINRKPIGKAFSGLQGKVLYPLICSTAARSGMNLVFCRSYPATLQLQTMLSLGKSMLLPDNVSLFKVLPDNIIPPGLKVWMKNNFWWITSNKEKQKKVETKTDKKQKTAISTSIETPGPSHGTRRARKTKKDQESDAGNAFSFHDRVTTRSMAARRTFMPGTNPIFAPAPAAADCPLPAKSPRVSRVSEITRPVTRSSSSPCVHDALNDDDMLLADESERPPRASSSASNQPGSKRMCLRSNKKSK
ncbi:uncharacterized protein LOC110848658 [Folsomia candida]|uniref:SPRY domain-containing SOCS box protein 3 n=1 Tax=Folsomia candida TaxID=158441 RepID=A0A226EG17_FOLCA|nr:uncharacterized protein LOC110848658 [Folsomia candida]XP_021951615.1 uncharacterized protein LOC110848658 [Folsomia candida]XP_035706640.1 uncharacterized protein LOC110848658 [Folsomia candida]OXA56603.1 SPRY domain-containing SOCS box protein 3 [Folsomia candida]